MTPAGGSVDLSPLLAPRSIAVIGASGQPGNLGGVAIRLLRKFGYPGAIWPVNPRHASVDDLPCHASVRALPGTPDLALFATGAESLPALLRECIDAGVRAGIAWAGGFAEVGAHGATLQDEVARLCADAGFALAGPNCIGIVDTWTPMTATFASFLVESDTLVRGDISMVSQSGGTATMAQALAERAGFGFRYMISSGNEAVLTIADYIEALAHDARTKVIAVYVEGVRDGERLVAALRKARAAGKPVVVLKGGDTAAAARAAAAHTGALAGEGRVWDAVFRECAVVRVRSLEELLDVALFLSSTDLAKLPRGSGVAIVTFGGGGGVLSADQCAQQGATTPRLSEATRARLAQLVPPIAAIDNPVDLTPQVYNQPQWFARFADALDVVAADAAIDSVLLQFGPMALRGAEVAETVLALRERTPKCVCYAWPLAPRGVPERLREAGVHVFTEYARAIAVLAALARRSADLAVPLPRAALPAAAFDWPALVRRAVDGTVVPEHDCHALLAAAGLPVADGRFARSEREAVEAFVAVGAPVAIKGISPAVTHRAAAGLVTLDVRNADDAAAAWRSLAARAHDGGIALDGVYVQRMVGNGVEVLVSAFRDPVFGPIVSCGAGGTLTELVDDVTLSRAPVDEAAALAMIGRLRIARRAEKARLDRAPLARFIARLSSLAACAPWRGFVLEVNPVKWNRDGVIAVDGLLIVEDATPPATATAPAA